MVSVWEIAVKHALGRLLLPDAPEEFVPEMRRKHLLTSLPLDEPSASRVASLEPLHKDPFDRMLVCQALNHGLTVVTPDEEIRQYPVSTLE